MKTLHYLALVSILLFSLASSCNKPEPEPEPEEQLPTGENTAYFYVDGQLIIPKGYTTGGTYIESIISESCDEQLDLNLLKFNENIARLSIHFKSGIQSTGVITLTTNDSGIIFCQNNHNNGVLKFTDVTNNGTSTKNYFTKYNSGTINITSLSSDKRKIIGTFDIIVYNTWYGGKKHITNGHFNINLNTLNQ